MSECRRRKQKKRKDEIHTCYVLHYATNDLCNKK